MLTDGGFRKTFSYPSLLSNGNEYSLLGQTLERFRVPFTANGKRGFKSTIFQHRQRGDKNSSNQLL